LNPSASQNTIRTFVAIPIPENTSLFLNKIQEQLKKNRVRTSWVKTSSMHLTLVFIGEIAIKDVQKIIRAMEATAVACAPFTLSATGVGVFPNIKKARVIWSGVKGQRDLLEKVHITLEKKLEQAGVKVSSKRFSPHFTLGRLKDKMDSRALAKTIQNFQQCASDPFRIKRMVLFKSDLNPSGAVHTPLFEVKFTGMVGKKC